MTLHIRRCAPRLLLSSALLLIAIGFVLAPPAKAATHPKWIQLRSPNFTVVTNDNEKRAHTVAREFELIRAVFLDYFGHTQHDGFDLTILAARDEQTLHSLIPEFWEKKNSMHPAGIFLDGRDENYIVLRLDIDLNQATYTPYEAVYHEYVHYLMRRLGPKLPLWMVEGLAEFYGNTRFEGNHVLVGSPSPRSVQLLRARQFLPLSKLFEVDRSSPYYHEESKTSIFYAEAWALTHYLIVRDWKEKTHRVNDFVTLLEKGVDAKDAAARTIGDPESLESVLQSYIQRFTFAAAEMDPPKIDETAFHTRELSDAESLAIRADFLLHDRHLTEAQAMLDESLKLDPKLPSAFAGMGLLCFRQWKTAEGGKWFSQAAALDPKNYMAHYGYALSLLMGTLNDDLASKAEASLRATIKIKPDFGPAYDSLAYLLSLTWHNQDPDEAYLLAVAAVEIDPANVSYRIRAVNVLERLGRADDALKAANLAVGMATTPQERTDTAAALASAQQIQSSKRKTAEVSQSQSSSTPGTKNPQAPSETAAHSASELARPPATGQPETKDESLPPKNNRDQPQASEAKVPIDVLSDTEGVDVSTYLNEVVFRKVYANWRALMPESVFAPFLKKGKVIVGFRLLQDGKVEDLRVAQTSGDKALDKAAYRAVANSSPFSPLASDFHCTFLELRFNFYYNLSTTQSPPPTGSFLPCVKTKILLPGETSVVIYPASVQVAKGASQQFTATVVGEQNSTVIWSVSGKGCSESSCGSISPTGGYTAPSAIPIPATVTITATLQTEGHETASAVVRIVESPPSQ